MLNPMSNIKENKNTCITDAEIKEQLEQVFGCDIMVTPETHEEGSPAILFSSDSEHIRYYHSQYYEGSSDEPAVLFLEFRELPGLKLQGKNLKDCLEEMLHFFSPDALKSSSS